MEFLADWDWDAMSSKKTLDSSGVLDRVGAPHVVWDTEGVSVQGWSGFTAYALDVSVSSSLEHRFAGPDALLARLDEVLKPDAAPDATLNDSGAAGTSSTPAGTRVYELRPSSRDVIVVLARAEIVESKDPEIRLRVVLWARPSSSRFAGTSAASIAIAYVRRTMDQMEPKQLMEDVATAFSVSSSSIDGAGAASIVASSQGQALSVLLQSRFLWWFTAVALVFASLFGVLIVLGGQASLNSLVALLTPLAAGVWGLVTTRRNWRRRTGR